MTTLGHTGVSTYIQSGNVVMTSPRSDRAAHGRRDLRWHRGIVRARRSRRCCEPPTSSGGPGGQSVRDRTGGITGADHVPVRRAVTRRRRSTRTRALRSRSIRTGRERAVRPLPERGRTIEDDARLLREAPERSRHRPQPQHRRQADRARRAADTTLAAMPAIAKLTVFALDCPDPHGLAEFYMGDHRLGAGPRQRRGRLGRATQRRSAQRWRFSWLPTISLRSGRAPTIRSRVTSISTSTISMPAKPRSSPSAHARPTCSRSPMSSGCSSTRPVTRSAWCLPTSSDQGSWPTCASASRIRRS